MAALLSRSKIIGTRMVPDVSPPPHTEGIKTGEAMTHITIDHASVWKHASTVQAVCFSQVEAQITTMEDPHGPVLLVMGVLNHSADERTGFTVTLTPEDQDKIVSIIQSMQQLAELD